MQMRTMCEAYTAGEIPTLCVALRVRHPLRLRSGQQATACWLRMTYPRPTVQMRTECEAYTAAPRHRPTGANAYRVQSPSRPRSKAFHFINPTKSDFIAKRLHPRSGFHPQSGFHCELASPRISYYKKLHRTRSRYGVAFVYMRCGFYL